VIQSATNFVEVMITVAVIALLSFLTYALTAYLRRTASTGAAREDGAAPRGVEFALATVLLLVISALLAWQVFGSGFQPGDDWRGGPRAVTFFVVMLVTGALGIVAFLVFLVTRNRSNVPGPARELSEATPAADHPVTKTPSAIRLVGLLLLALALLLVGWVYLSKPDQQTLMSALIYPASLAVALVMLFDKASRTWDTKAAAESAREWLLCDAIVVLLVLAYFNLLNHVPETGYGGFFWDMVYVALTFAVLWMVDRKVTSARFIIVYGYLVLVPVLLLVWQAQNGISTPEDLSWWSTIWPFFGLAIVFLAVEIVAQLIPTLRQMHAVLCAKDLVFVVIYAVLLIGAVPEVAG
jgi:hypothetical protein